MNRRNWMKALGAATALKGIPACAGMTTQPGIDAGAAGASPTQLQTEIVRLKLRHTWTTTMSSSEYRDTLHVRFIRDGVTGHGEGAPIVRYKENAADAEKAVESVRDLVIGADPWQFEKLRAEIARRVEGQYAAKAAIDIAVMDWVGQKLGVPLYRYFGLDPRDAPITTFSIGIDTPEITRQKVREAEPFPVLKIKVGLSTDEATIAAVRSVTDKPLRVDANEGWKDKEVAVRKINWLATQGVEFVEQPMPADMLEEMHWVHERVSLPLIADESCQHASEIPKLVGTFAGVNVKLDKAGGILEAFKMIQMARALGLKTMLGCMISSSVSVTAAAHLSPLVDYADLDGNLLIANDPFSGVQGKNGKLLLPDRPGLGLARNNS
ncbi:MAG: dipeptide epimerase [Terriglobia bacterium]|jgi:L-alanine-DL-glutamate epimerase-like enolase superfamily enzyme